MKISKEGRDLEGAVSALIAFKTNFGYTLDDDEVKVIIRISRLDTNLYNDIAITSKKIGKNSIFIMYLSVRTYNTGKDHAQGQELRTGDMGEGADRYQLSWSQTGVSQSGVGHFTADFNNINIRYTIQYLFII